MLAYFSMRLKQLRAAKGMTQSEVALYVGVSRSVISAYESDLRYPSYEILTRFVEPEKGYIGSFNVLDHWAAPAAIKAASAGWIDDVPIDLNAPATYGTFANLLAKIFAL